MARAPDQRVQQAEAMFLTGKKLVEIANELNLPEGTDINGKANVRKTIASVRKKKRTFGKRRKLLLKR